MVSLKLIQLAIVALTCAAVHNLPTAGDGGNGELLDARQGPCAPCGLVSSVSTMSSVPVIITRAGQRTCVWVWMVSGVGLNGC